MSAALPMGAPPSAHADSVATSASVSDGSPLNFVMPTWRSMYHGGISRLATFCLIARAQGRASSYVSSDIGAIAPGRWQVWQERCRMGATSFVNVTRSVRDVTPEDAANDIVRAMPPRSRLLTTTHPQRGTFYKSLAGLKACTATVVVQTFRSASAFRN